MNHTVFSNAAICINFEIEAKYVGKLLKRLNTNGLSLIKESIELAEIFTENIEEKYKEKEIMGAINITFVHNDPDLIITSPDVPG